MECEYCGEEPADVMLWGRVDYEQLSWRPACGHCADNTSYCEAGDHFEGEYREIRGLPRLEADFTWSFCGAHQELAERQLVENAVRAGIKDAVLSERLRELSYDDAVAARMNSYAAQIASDPPAPALPDGGYDRRFIAMKPIVGEPLPSVYTAAITFALNQFVHSEIERVVRDRTEQPQPGS